MKKLLLLFSFIALSTHYLMAENLYDNFSTTNIESMMLEIKNMKANELYNLAEVSEKEKRYDLAELLYLRAIEKGNIDSMNNLGIIYSNQNKYDLAEKYLLMAVKNGYKESLNNIAILYKREKNMI